MCAALAFNHKPTILLADDHQPILRTVSGMVAPHFDVVASVSDGQAALDAAARTKPVLVLSDISMPRLDGILAARELKKRDSHAKVVFLTGFDDDDYISEALSAGAKGYVVKKRMQSDLVPALYSVVVGQFFISPNAFTGSSTFKKDTHALHLYSDEIDFVEQVSTLTYAALHNSEQVLMFMSKMGLGFVRNRLRAMGLDYSEAIERGNLHVFSIENLLPALMKGGANFEAIERLEHDLFSTINTGSNLDPARLEAFFSRFFHRVVARSRESSSKALIISDLMATLLKQGYGQEFAACAESIWNDLIPKQNCTVYCGCPAAYLGSQPNRHALAEICAQHSNVIPFDKHSDRVGQGLALAGD